MPLYRPPAEADSVIVKVADGCPCNRCTFCGMYRGVPYRPHPREEWLCDIAAAAAARPAAPRVFLADGDVMALPFDDLVAILEEVGSRFPRLMRISVYANGSSIQRRTDEQLRALHQRRLHTLYMGLESGDEAVLRAVRKTGSAATMIEAVQRAQACGFRMSVMVLIGLAGAAGSASHAAATAAAVNAMQPRLLSALRVIPVPGTPLYDAVRAGAFRPLSEYEAVAEVRALVAQLNLKQTVFRADHRSNVVPLAARLPKDRQRLLATLDALLASTCLDREGPDFVPGPL